MDILEETEVSYMVLDTPSTDRIIDEMKVKTEQINLYKEVDTHLNAYLFCRINIQLLMHAFALSL